MQNVFFLSIGAVLGANARYWITHWVTQQWGDRFPWGTLLINLSGSFVLGLLFVLAMNRFEFDPRLRILLFTGFLGSYTTFSTYTNESITLMLQGQTSLGLANLIGSAVLGGVAAGLGVWVGRAL